MKSFRLLLVTMLTLAGIGQVRAQEAYAVVTKNADSQPVSVTFYYDNNKSSFGTDVTVVEDLNATNVYKQWAGATLTSATFDSSFKNYTGLTSLYQWFYWCSALTSIEGLTNMNAENVTTTQKMFYQCSALTELDLTSFNPVQVQNSQEMFCYCSKLETIYAAAGTDWNSITTSYYMFQHC